MTAREPKTPSTLDRAFRAAFLTAGIAAILMIGLAWVLWPNCSDWDLQKSLCAVVMSVGAVAALGASLIGTVWLECSRYPSWRCAWAAGLLFLAFIFGIMPRL